MLRLLTLMSVLSLALVLSANPVITNPEKTINITVDESGLVYMGRDTLPIVEVSEEVHLRLWKGYLGTGKMPDAIHVAYLGNASELYKEEIDKALKDAQAKTIQKYCLQNHKKKYEDISGSQQEKLKRKYPVLFSSNWL